MKVDVKFKGDELNMSEALRKFLEAGHKLLEVWDNDKVKSYPKYLPSFDEFLADFKKILEDTDK